jgi:hypothetical protein
VTQTLLRRDEHAFRLPRLDSGTRGSQQLCSSSSLAAPSDILLIKVPLRHPVREGNVAKDLHSVLELACDRHSHHLAL